MDEELDQEFADVICGQFPDRRVVQCNLTVPTSAAARGARAYVVLVNRGNGSDRIEILLRSRSGRWVEKWEDIRHLDHFRAKTIPFGHPIYGRLRLWTYEPEQTAAELAQARQRRLAVGA